METGLRLDILPQPDDRTCGPTCLHALYSYYKAPLPLDQVIAEVPQLEGGGTLAVLLGCHALKRGYQATIYTYNLQMFDPTWWAPGPSVLRERLMAQAKHKTSHKLQVATEAYLQFLELGGLVRFEDLTPTLIRRYLSKQVPILTGLSATYLYRTAREFGPEDDYDDIRGYPSGHFVIVCGYNSPDRTVLVADPTLENPVAKDHYYQVSIDRLVCSILLGILTYDANLLIIQPKKQKGPARHGHAGSRE
jgi:hypothetical protein